MSTQQERRKRRKAEREAECAYWFNILGISVCEVGSELLAPLQNASVWESLAAPLVTPGDGVPAWCKPAPCGRYEMALEQYKQEQDARKAARAARKGKR